MIFSLLPFNSPPYHEDEQDDDHSDQADTTVTLSVVASVSRMELAWATNCLPSMAVSSSSSSATTGPSWPAAARAWGQLASLALESHKPASLACRQLACPQAVFDYEKKKN